MAAGKAFERFDAVIVDSDLSTRSNLKQAAHADVHFKGVFSVNTLRDGLERLVKNENCDVFFLSYTFGQDDIMQFIAEAKSTPIGSECAYILVMKPIHQNAGDTSASLMSGAHGFLYEPFSADGMKEISEIANRIKKEAQDARVAAAIAITLSSVADEIDSASAQRKLKNDSSQAILTDKTMSELKRIQRLPADQRHIYIEQAIAVFEAAKPPAGLSYAGPSQRVKERLQRKLLEKGDKGKVS